MSEEEKATDATSNAEKKAKEARESKIDAEKKATEARAEATKAEDAASEWKRTRDVLDRYDPTRDW